MSPTTAIVRSIFRPAQNAPIHLRNAETCDRIDLIMKCKDSGNRRRAVPSCRSDHAISKYLRCLNPAQPFFRSLNLFAGERFAWFAKLVRPGVSISEHTLERFDVLRIIKTCKFPTLCEFTPLAPFAPRLTPLKDRLDQSEVLERVELSETLNFEPGTLNPPNDLNGAQR